MWGSFGSFGSGGVYLERRDLNPPTKPGRSGVPESAGTKSFWPRCRSAHGGCQRLQALVFSQNPAALDLEG